jgi:hypothetical protein
MSAADPARYWSNELRRALGPLDREQLNVAVRASVDAELAGAGPEDSLWAGKTAASNWEDDHAAITPTPEHDGYRVVAIVDSPTAEVFRASLSTAGIPVILQYGSGRVLGFTAGPAGEVSVLVPPNQLSEARKLLGY